LRDTAVDIERAVEGNYNVGWMAPGEWLLYTVNVGTSGTYRLDLRVAANGSGGQLHVEFDGVNKTGALTIPNTGGWQAWTTISTQVTLGSGVQRMRVAVDSAGPTGVVGNLNFIDVTPLVSGPSTPQDLVLYTTDIPVTSLHGSWARASGDASPARIKLRTSDAGYAITSNPLAAPTHYLEATFTPVANTEYALWLRLKSKDNNKYNDSVWVQFSGARYQGAGVYPLNSTQGLLVILPPTPLRPASMGGDGQMARTGSRSRRR